MTLYLINTLLALILTKSFWTSKDGTLRVIMIVLFGSLACYQLTQFLICVTDLKHGTTLSLLSKLPFTIIMAGLVCYIYKKTIINYYNKCLNFLIQLQKRIQK